MFGTVDTGVLVLLALMLALGLGPALLALSSRRSQAPVFERRAASAHRFFFGAATAARRASLRAS